MTTHWKFAALAALLLLAGCNKDEPAAAKEETKAKGPGITLTAEQSEAMGLATAKLQPSAYRGELSGYGVVSTFDAVAQADADTATAEASAVQSGAAATRARELSTGADAPVSRESYEAAAAKSAADQAALLLARRKADAAFGINAPWRGAQRGAILARLQSGRSVLVHVTFPVGALISNGVNAQRLRITRMGANSKSWLTSNVWAAPADPTVPGRSFFALVDGSDLAQGERVIAAIPTGAPQAGVIVPAAALLLGESESWVYLKTREGTYLRTRIDTSRPAEGGYFVPGGAGLGNGQDVVTQGAGLLYAHEINPSTEPEE